MILDFKFKNYMSFADECEFTMVANQDSAHEDSLMRYSIGEKQNVDRVARTRIIYGANASGKSTIINAIDFLVKYTKFSNMMMVNNKIPVRPFKFTDNAEQNPTDFSITFVIEGVKYTYEMTCTRDKVINEKLLMYTSNKASTVFERTNTNEYRFVQDKTNLEQIKEKNSENKLFLSTSATWNYSKTMPVVNYILDKIRIVTNVEESWTNIYDDIVNNHEEEEYKKFCLDILNSADFSIKDYICEIKKISDFKELGRRGEAIYEYYSKLADGDAEALESLVNTNAYNFKTMHTVEGGKDYVLNLIEESLGTRQMFYLTPILYKAFKNGEVLFVDEIDRSLHPLLVEYIIKLFNDPDKNKNGAQLIANTHDTNLLNLDIFRRDDIWFTERDYKTGKTELYSLADFSPRTTENIEKGYLLGRYGAVPLIKE